MRTVFRVIKHTIDKHGRQLLIPELDVDVWYTSLPNRYKHIIEFYQQ